MARSNGGAARNGGSEPPRTPGATRRGSTRHVRVDDRVAEILVEDFPVFCVVEVREACEYEPVRMAMAILQWAAGKADPSRALVGWARNRRRGYYRPREKRPDEAAEYGRYLKHLERKEAEAVNGRGYGLSHGEEEKLSALWYAPAHRARTAGITHATHCPAQEELEEGDDVA